MKIKVDDEQVKKFIGNVFDGAEVEVIHNRPEEIYVRVTRMYDSPRVSIAKLNAIAQYFDAQDVDVNDTIREGGCETCDYGSAYGFYLRIWN